MFLKIGSVTLDAVVTDNGRAFHVRNTVQPQGMKVTNTISPMRSQTFKHSVVRKCKKKG